MDIFDVLASGMIRSGGGDPAKAFFNSWSSTDDVSMSASHNSPYHNHRRA
jgi:hypothetical protein